MIELKFIEIYKKKIIDVLSSFETDGPKRKGVCPNDLSNLTSLRYTGGSRIWDGIGDLGDRNAVDSGTWGPVHKFPQIW